MKRETEGEGRGGAESRNLIADAKSATGGTVGTGGIGKRGRGA
jgi:hypothetical protein